MHRGVLSGANSLGKFIARPDHGVDRLRWGPKAQERVATHWWRFDAVQLGRQTYEVAAQSAQGGGDLELEACRPYQDGGVFVSHRVVHRG